MFLPLPHCGCATPLHNNFKSDNFTFTIENFQDTQHLQMHADIHENLYDELFYSSTFESGGVKQTCEPILNNKTWRQREEENKTGNRMLKTVQI